MLKNIFYSGTILDQDDKFLKYKLKLINSILLIAIVSSFFMAILFMFIGNNEVQPLIITLEIIYGISYVILFIYLRRNINNLKLVVYISMLSLYLLQVIIMINMLEDSFREAWYFITIIISYFLAGRRFGNLMLLLIFITMVIYNFQPYLDTNLNTVESILPLLLLLLIGSVIHLYERTKENYELSLKEANLLLANKIEELNQFNINLEARVKEEVKINSKHELKLFEQSKMASMGEMIGNIAHQWRQPLSTISTISTGAKLQKEMNLLTNEMFNKDMDIINDNAQYLSKTIDDFRNFVKGERVEKLFSLSTEIDSFLHLLEGNIKSHYIDVNLDLNDDIQLLGYPNELMQCLINIFNNSKDVLDSLTENNRLISIKTYIKNKTVYLTLQDNGGGIPNDVLPKIFDPYFTTKHQSKGTGLGLNMTYKLIVEGMNGTIEAKNINFIYKEKEYKGARFIITLPITN